MSHSSEEDTDTSDSEISRYEDKCYKKKTFLVLLFMCFLTHKNHTLDNNFNNKKII